MSGPGAHIIIINGMVQGVVIGVDSQAEEILNKLCREKMKTEGATTSLAACKIAAGARTTRTALYAITPD